MPFQPVSEGMTVICQDIDEFFFYRVKLWGGTMKARPEKRAFARRFSLIFVLLLSAAAISVSNSAAQQQAEQAQPAQPSAEQATIQPSQPPPVAQSGQDTAEAPRPEVSPAQQPAESVPAPPEQTSKGQAEQPAQAQTQTPSTSPEQVPAPSTAAQPSGPIELHIPDAAASQSETASSGYPPEYFPLKEKTSSSLMSANFTFYPIKALDPFIPFLVPETAANLGEDEQDQKAAPLTPLQKMTLSEIEKGLKAITWGELGKKAVIEDATGRGYIVGIGTPAGEHSGVITQISSDHLVIQQEIWDRKAKKRFPQEYTVKLVKKMDNQKR
jgi:type IV pilus assembly protein PilP